MTRSLLTVTLLSRTYAARYLFFSLDATFATSYVLMGAYQCAIESQRDHSRTFARLSVGRCGWARLRLGRFRRTLNWHVRGERRIRTKPATLFGSCHISRCGRHLPTTAEMVRLKLPRNQTRSSPILTLCEFPVCMHACTCMPQRHRYDSVQM